MERSGVEWSGAEWSGWSGVERSGVEWSGQVRGKGTDGKDAHGHQTEAAIVDERHERNAQPRHQAIKSHETLQLVTCQHTTSRGVDGKSLLGRTEVPTGKSRHIPADLAAYWSPR